MNPALRSRGAVREKAQTLCDDPGFRAQVTELVAGPPAGRLLIPTLAELAERLRALELAVADLREAGIVEPCPDQ